MVNSKAEAEDAVARVKYHPDGIRSNGGVRGDWGRFASHREYVGRAMALYEHGRRNTHKNTQKLIKTGSAPRA